MKRKLNTPILGLFAALEEIFSSAHGKVTQWGFTAREYSDRIKQKSANPAKKTRRKMTQASQRKNRV